MLDADELTTAVEAFIMGWRHAMLDADELTTAVEAFIASADRFAPPE
jgi:hypothetical protein